MTHPNQLGDYLRLSMRYVLVGWLIELAILLGLAAIAWHFHQADLARPLPTIEISPDTDTIHLPNIELRDLTGSWGLSDLLKFAGAGMLAYVLLMTLVNYAHLRLQRRFGQAVLSPGRALRCTIAGLVLRAICSACAMLAIAMIITRPDYEIILGGLLLLVAAAGGAMVSAGIRGRLEHPTGAVRVEPPMDRLMPLLKVLLAVFPKRVDLQVVDLGTIYFAASATSAGRRIFLSRHLLDLLDDHELLAILAHEFGHLANKDTFWRKAIGLAMQALGLAATAWAMTRLLSPECRYTELAFGVCVGLVILWVWGFAADRVLLAVIRAQERRAHKWALQATGDGPALVSAIGKISRSLGSPGDKPSWPERLLFGTHPALGEIVALADSKRQTPLAGE